MTDKLVAYVYQSWTDLDQAAAGLTPAEATTPVDGGSSIAWTFGHVTNQIDSWLNIRFQGLAPQPLIADARFRTGGDGRFDDWEAMLAGVADVRVAARRYLDAAPDLDRVIPYDGSLSYLRLTGLPLRYALLRIAAHHFLHAGEIVTVRSRLGNPAADGWTWGLDLL